MDIIWAQDGERKQGSDKAVHGGGVVNERYSTKTQTYCGLAILGCSLEQVLERQRPCREPENSFFPTVAVLDR